MSIFEVRAFAADGVTQDRVLSGARLEFTDEFGGEGYVKVTLPRSAAIEQGLDHGTEVAVFRDGVELSGSRARLVETQGNPSSGQDIAGESSDAVWGGRTFHTSLKQVTVYPSVWPVDPTKGVQSYSFKNATPGRILKTLLDAARARGAAQDFTYGSFSDTTDSEGFSWIKTIAELEYKPGVDIKSVLENFIRLGVAEFRWVGRDLRIYNADSYGADRTTGSSPICLYRGLSVNDSPYSESSDEVVNAILVMGDDGTFVERVDTDSIALYGRREGSLSQGGTKDTGILTWLADTTLLTSSKMRGEYTVRINPTADGPIPFVDFEVGDWVLFDRVAGQAPERFRVRQISVSADGESHNVVVTLNDKFAELDLRTQKKIDGIIGGAAMGNMDGSSPTVQPVTDATTPSPPISVSSLSGSYMDTASGVSRAAATTLWAAPSTNTDGSAIDDLARFEVQHRTAPTSSYAPSTQWLPMQADPQLQSRWDRRGKDKTPNWVGADGGSSVRAADGDDWFFWSDVSWGTMDQSGKVTLNSIPRSAITKSDPDSLNDLRGFAATANLLPETVANTTSESAWIGNASRQTVTSPFGPVGKVLRFGGSNSYAIINSVVDVVPGRKYLITFRFDTAVTTAAGAYAAQYRWQSNKNASPSMIGGPVTITRDGAGWARAVVTAPSGAASMQLALVTGSATQAGQTVDVSYIGVFETSNALQSWQPPARNEVVTNEVTNPDGAGLSVRSSDEVIRTNLSMNPSGEVNTDRWALYNGSTVSRVTTGGWTGSSFVRITVASTGALAAMHYPVPVTANVQHVARVRVKGTAGRSLTVTIANYAGGSGLGYGNSASLILTGSWQEVSVPASPAHPDQNQIGIQFVKDGPWSAGDVIDVDGVEVYQGTSLPGSYFDGDSIQSGDVQTRWTGTPHASASQMFYPSVRRRNFVANPNFAGASFSAVSATGASFRPVEFDTPDRTYGSIPEVVNAAALSTWFSELSNAQNKSIGIGVFGDSCTESTGSPSSPDLSDRYFERLQGMLRRDTAVAGVPLAPQGYYGSVGYIPAAFAHGGPVDWQVLTSDESKYPVVGGHVGGIGPGGRYVQIGSGQRLTFTAEFQSFRLSYSQSTWGRNMRVLVDGKQEFYTNTYVSSDANRKTLTWQSPTYTSGPHTVVIEYVPTPGLWAGEILIAGADLYDGDQNKGVRAYDFSASGKAAQDYVTSPSQVDDSIAGRSLSLAVIMLGFNDFGRARTAQQFQDDVLAMITRIKNKGFSGPFLLVGQWQAPQLTPGVAGETQANFRAKLRAIAESTAGVAYVDLSSVMPPTDYAPWGDQSYYVDGLHPSALGHRRIADALYGVLRQPVSGVTRSLSVTTNGGGTNQGVTILPADVASWAVGAQYSAGTWVKAPSDAQMELRVFAPGAGAGVVTPFTGTGSWQWVTSPTATVTSAATAAPRMLVRTASSQASLSFFVTRVMITQGAISTYFDGGSSDTSDSDFAWTGSDFASVSVDRARVATGWTGSSNMSALAARFDPNVYSQGVGSLVLSDASYANTYRQVQAACSVPSGKYVTVIAMIRSEAAVTTALVRMMAGETYIGGSTAVVPVQGDDGWYEVRWSGVLTQAATAVRVVAYGSFQPGSKTWFSEVTVVANDGWFWRGTPFHGGQRGQGIETSEYAFGPAIPVRWLGTAHASKSVMAAYDSASAASPSQKGSLLHPAAAGGNASEYLWVTGAIKHPAQDKAWVFCNGMRNRAMREYTGWNFQRNGTIYFAEWDMSNDSLTRFVAWFDSQIQWGEAACVSGAYLYVYGSSGSPGKQHVFRVPAADPFGGTREVWAGSDWSTSAAAWRSPGVIGTMATNGSLSGVREFNGKWIGVHVAGYMNNVDGYEAPNPWGPFTRVGSVYDFPQDSSHSLKYVARFHPQMDSAETGIVVSYSEAGEGVYGAKFVRGTRGVPVATFTEDDVWQDHPPVEHSPDYMGGLIPGWSYQARVRAVDDAGNVSEWAEGTPIVLEGDVVAPPKPATPIATSFFRGARIIVSGLTAAGGAFPADFARLTVHMGTDSGFRCTDDNQVDALTTRGGISVVSGLEWGKTYWFKVQASDRTGNRSEESEGASAAPERLSDADLPAKLIDGAKHIKDRSLSVQNFSVGAFDNSLVPNGNMEEQAVGATLPTGWSNGYARGDYDWSTKPWSDAGEARSDTDSPLSGSRSIRIDVKPDMTRQLVSAHFVLVPGDVYYVRAKVRTSRELGSQYLDLGLTMGSTAEKINGFADPASVNVSAVASDGSASSTGVVIEGQVEVPDVQADGSGYPMRFGAVYFWANPDGADPYTVWIDDVEVRQVVGEASIANASINRAKIRYLAVDDARISSVSVGKLVAGELWADITVSARVMTSTTGQRVEMNRDGLFSYNGLNEKDANGVEIPTTEIRASDGGLVSRWIRTNTEGTRIEMGSYSMGGRSALMSFHPKPSDTAPDGWDGTWQFPPAFGFGGAYRQGSVPGLAMHAGSVGDGTNGQPDTYRKYGMNMIAVDQVGGVHMVTGNLLDGSPATDGAPIRVNASGNKAYIDIRSGGSGDPAMLRLDPKSGSSVLSLNKGKIQFLTTEGSNFYFMQFSTWLGFNHINLDVGSGGFRISNAASDSAFVVNPQGIIKGSGPWGAPRIRTNQGSDHFITWDESGNAYLDGSTNRIKTFVIEHPVDRERYLVHAAHEGDEMRVVYEGSGATSGGSATVRLPDYFDALVEQGTDVVFVNAVHCGNATCQCSVRATRVRDGRFTVHVVSGPRNHSEVSFVWRVTAVRRDTDFEVEPVKADTVVAGDGPYTYIRGNK